MIVWEPYEPTPDDYKYVVRMVGKMQLPQCNYALDFEDHVQAGYEGLLKALRDWNERKMSGNFRRFSHLYIKWAIYAQTIRLTRLSGGSAYKNGYGERVPKVYSIDSPIGDGISQQYSHIDYFDYEKKRRKKRDGRYWKDEAKLIRQGQIEKVLNLDALTHWQRRVFDLRVAGVTRRKIGEMFGIKRDSVKGLLHRIYKTIRLYTPQ